MLDKNRGERGDEVFDAAARVRELLALLQLEPAGEDRFRAASCARSLPFVFGGQVASQALAAAYRTVEHRRVHSLHAYFLESGDPHRPLDLRVGRVRDGKSFSVREVSVSQGARTIFCLTASFTVSDRPGFDHSAPSVPAPEPESLAPLEDWLAPHHDALPQWWSGPLAIDLRYVEEPPHVLTRPGRAADLGQTLWLRSFQALPDEDWVHACFLTFASDLNLLDPVLLAHGRSWYDGTLRAASLDHAIWFHRPFRVDSWLKYVQLSPAAHGGLGFARGDIFDQAGRLVASVAQQGVISSLQR